ncbi:MAG: sulfotransferase [Saprospiraceae bacterium]
MNLAHKIRSKAIEDLAWLKQIIAEKSASGIPPTRFVIISNIRTGSTMLQNLINSHPNARCFSELFHRHKDSIAFGIEGYKRRGANPAYVQFRNENPVGFLEQNIFKGHPKNIYAVGFKLLYTQCRQGFQFWEGEEYAYWWHNVGIEPKWETGKRCVWEYLASEKIRIIHLTRNNFLESKVSSLVAQETGKWSMITTRESIGKGFKKVYLNPKEILNDLKAEGYFREETRQRFKDNSLLETTYEALTENREEELIKIQTFLNLPQKKMNSPTKKQAKYSLQEVVENYDEISSLLKEKGSLFQTPAT